MREYRGASPKQHPVLGDKQNLGYEERPKGTSQPRRKLHIQGKTTGAASNQSKTPHAEPHRPTPTDPRSTDRKPKAGPEGTNIPKARSQDPITRHKARNRCRNQRPRARTAAYLRQQAEPTAPHPGPHSKPRNAKKRSPAPTPGTPATPDPAPGPARKPKTADPGRRSPAHGTQHDYQLHPNQPHKKHSPTVRP